MRIDEFFNKQPEAKFIDWLNRPMHDSAPKSFARVVPDVGEVSVKGIYIAECPQAWHDAILTATDDFEKFLRLVHAFGSNYPVKIISAEEYGEENYKISISDIECVIYASDSEGARRAIYYLEEEMIKREGALFPLGEIVRTSGIKKRITRGFFSPTNRAPKWGDELLDEIDYYPENYLNRLAHNGTNGIWIYTSFEQLISSPYIPSKDQNCERRMEKLRSVVEKCKKYGIKVYLFAIEPMGLLRDERELYADMLGVDNPDPNPEARRPLCPRIKKTREHVIYCLEHIFGSIPDLAGYITIPAGERTTTCVSTGSYKKCPRCGQYSRGENLAYSVDLIKEGLRRAGTGAELISWTYGHRYWNDADIAEYIEDAPSDVVLMQNFEDKGLDIQLGKPRIAWDYWLSYPGPSEMFSMSARVARKHGKQMYAKMQVCSSHEIATVPYIPVPGILFDKYKEALSLGVTGIMECWYFGNYPSLMNRASTELSYLDDDSDKEQFLLELASRLYGQSNAKAMAKAWRAFEEGYRNYPTNIMLSYYGPMHDGVVWNLYPIPVNRALPRSWLLLDPPDGDRIGECLFKGHTLDEAITLTDRMCKSWQKGCALLPLPKNDEHSICAAAIGLLFESGRNILKFYKLREQLGKGEDDPWETVTEMERIVVEEMAHSGSMIELCNADPRMGYHSEAEGFKFFPEKLKARISKLERLLDTDFSEIRSRLLNGKQPLGCYYAEGEDYYPLGNSADSFQWEKIDKERAFGAYICGDDVMIPIRCRENDTFSVCFEFALFQPESTISCSPRVSASNHAEVSENCKVRLSLGPHVLSHQSVYGNSIDEELSKYRIESEFKNGKAEHLFSAKIPKEKWNGKCAIRLKITINGIAWRTDPDPVRTLGKYDLSPGDFGVLLPVFE